MDSHRGREQYAKGRHSNRSAGSPTKFREQPSRKCKENPPGSPYSMFRSKRFTERMKNECDRNTAVNSLNFHGRCTRSKVRQVIETGFKIRRECQDTVSWGSSVEEDTMSMEPFVNNSAGANISNGQSAMDDEAAPETSETKGNASGFQFKLQAKADTTIHSSNQSDPIQLGGTKGVVKTNVGQPNPSPWRADECCTPTEPRFDQRMESCDSENRLLSSDNLEVDIFFVNSTSQQRLNGPPPEVNKDYADTATRKPWQRERMLPLLLPAKRNPQQSSLLYVSHPYKTDSVLGDKFGARLDTFEEKYYNRHILKEVLHQKPADKMQLRDKDELVLINNNFVPVMNHADVLNLFQHLPVDGKTKIVLVIRRNVGPKKWQWYKSSAVFTPDTRYTTHTFPEVNDLSFNEISDNKTSFHCDQRYRLEDVDQFLDLKPTGVSVSVLHNNDSDKTKVITKKVHISQDDQGHYTYWCCLCSHDSQCYLAVNEHTRNVQVQIEEPKPFKYTKVASQIFFKNENLGLYLAYDGVNVTLSEDQYQFQELPPHAGLDHCDMASSFTSNSSQDSGYIGTPELSPEQPRKKYFTRNASVGLSEPINNLNIG